MVTNDEKRLLVREIGIRILGSTWMHELSKKLSVNLRTVQRWNAGTMEIPDMVLLEFMKLTKIDLLKMLDLINETEEHFEKLKGNSNDK